MKLKSIEIENFEGIRKASLGIDGDADYIADNEGGKTGIADSISWCLYGKDREGKTKFKLRPIEEVVGFTGATEVTLSFDDETVLKRSYSEKIKKGKKRTDPKTIQGSSKYWINDLGLKSNVKKIEFDSFINSMVDKDVFPIISDPEYFTSLKWELQRDRLFKVCELDDSAAKKQELKIKNLKAELTDLGKEIDGLKTRRDENEGSLPVLLRKVSREVVLLEQKAIQRQISKLSINDTDSEVENIEIQITAEEDRINLVEVNLNKDIKVLEDQIDNKIKEQKNEIDFGVSNNKTQLGFICKNIEDVNGDINCLNRDISGRGLSVRNKESQIERYRGSYVKKRDEKFIHEKECDKCGTVFTEETINIAKVAFEDAKEKPLDEIMEHATESKNELSEIKKSIVEAESDKIKSLEKLENLNKEYEAINKVILESDEKKKLVVEDHNLRKQIENLQEFKIDNSKLDGLKLALEQINELANSQNNDDEIEILQEKIADLNKEIVVLEKTKEIEDRLEELQQESLQLLEDEEQLHEKIEIAESEMKARCQELEEVANEKFRPVSFKLFEILKNGEIKNTCVSVFENKPSEALNKAAKRNVGLSIINTYCKHYQVNAPIVIDNAESVTEIIETDSQQIRLYVMKGESIPGVELFEKIL